MKNNSAYDAKLILKKTFIFLLLCFPVMLIIATTLTILNVPVWAIFICTILVGGAMFMLIYVLYLKKKEKQEEKRTSNFDPFKD